MPGMKRKATAPAQMGSAKRRRTSSTSRGKRAFTRRWNRPIANAPVKQTFIKNFTLDVPANYVDPLLYGFKISLTGHNPDARALATIYDEYRLTKVQVTFTPSFINRTGDTPMEVLCVDVDDGNVNGQTFTDLLNYTGARVGITGVKRIAFTPHFKAGAMLENGNLTAVQVKTGWLDSVNQDVEFYGYKAGYQNNFANPTAYKVNIQEKIWVEYRHKR